MNGKNLPQNWFYVRVAVITAFVISLILVYYDALYGDFVYDDWFLIYLNPQVKDFSVSGIKALFTAHQFNHFLPVRMFSYMLDYKIWGMDAFGFHITNLLLHCLNSVLLIFTVSKVAERTGTEKIRAFVAGVATAILFAIHPMLTESVSWISGRKELLATFFCLCSFLSYLESTGKSGSARVFLLRAVSTIFFALASMSKASTVAFPFFILAADFAICSDGALKNLPKSIARSLPLLVAGLFFFFLNYYFSSSEGIIQPLYGGGPWSHFLTILKIPLIYLERFVWPARLSIEYSFTVEHSPFSLIVAASAILWLSAAFLWLRWRTASPLAACFLSWVFINLLPVMNIIPTHRLTTDRYAYLPSIGLLALAGFAVANIAVPAPSGAGTGIRGIKNSSLAAAIIVFLLFASATCALALSTMDRNEDWQNDFTLWVAAYELEPHHPEVLTNLGHATYRTGDYIKSAQLFSHALEIDPDNFRALVNLASIFIDHMHRFQEAEKLLVRATEINPARFEAWENLAIVRLRLGDFEGALNAATRSMELTPNKEAANHVLDVIISEAGKSGIVLQDPRKNNE